MSGLLWSVAWASRSSVAIAYLPPRQGCDVYSNEVLQWIALL